MSPTKDEQWVSVDGRRLKISHLGKVMYPQTGTTKGEVIDYYSRIADQLVPYAAGRPVTRKRWVHGVGTDDEPGEVFFQKNLDDRSTPEWVRRRPIAHSTSTKDYPLAEDRATLVWLAQIASLELHVPQWRFAPDGERSHPDRLVIDLDPGPGAELAACAEVAHWARDLLTGMGLDPMPVTSGSKGIHLYARLDGAQSSEEVSAVAHELARVLEADHPELVVSDMKKTLREGKVLVDWSQNNGNKTTIVPYSLRGRSRPTVAAPRTWDEIGEPGLRHLDFHEVLDRAASLGDVLSPLLGDDDATSAHESSTPGRADRLATYRSMRDAAKTPEPVPAAAPSASDSRTFVIQEHHARRLHWDFRLEHDGVLVSWALPKGVPTETGANHLAVQTEDHPIEYGGFEGDIPGGEYGAGHVDIWDRGTYELEKWRDGEEVIVTVHGEKHGTAKYALIRTTSRDEKKRQWLIHLMKEQPSTTGDAPPARTRSTRSLPSPMLATLGSPGEIDENEDDWTFEMKWDGFRAVAEVAAGAVRVMSRNALDMTSTFPELGDLLRTVDVDVVLDGEIVALGPAGAPDFGRLQTRAGLTRPGDVEAARSKAPVHFLLFDILERDGVDLTDRPYTERRALLESTVRSSGAVQVPPVFDGDLASAMSSSRTLGLEGVMAKRDESTYAVGRRSRSWLKLKHNRTQEVVVVGWRPGNGSRAERVGALLLAVPEGGELHYVGRVGTGFNERDLDEMLARFQRMERTTPPLGDVPRIDARGARWVTAKLVGEVEFAEWTSSGRLRQPRWRGWRADKDAAEVRREE
jgi:bifunctional non-homologous end joining protein LigD